MHYREYAEKIDALKRDVKPYPSPEWSAFWQENIALAQQVSVYEIDGQAYQRLPYGQGDWWEHGAPAPLCHDCAVIPGQLHVPGCDMEECPKCHGQAISCGCGSDEEE